jgi:hypothetical protein
LDGTTHLKFHRTDRSGEGLVDGELEQEEIGVAAALESEDEPAAVR